MKKQEQGTEEPTAAVDAGGRTEGAGEPGTVSRRDALRALGLVAGGVAAAAVVPVACAPNASPTRQTATAASATPAATRDTTAAGAGMKSTFFTPHERDTVTVLVDYIIPRDARSGSATDAGVPAWMDAFLAEPETEYPDGAFGVAIRGGLAWLDAESERRTGVPFARATDEARRAILDDIAYPKRARPEMSQGVAFFNRFRDFTASGFFSSKLGQQDLQYLGNVAVPVWDGCPPAALAKLGVSYDLMATRVAPRTGGVRA